MNGVLKRESQARQDQAGAQFEQPRQPPRRFMSRMYPAGTWSAPQRVVIPCEAHEQGLNRRAEVTNRPGAEVWQRAVYDEYTGPPKRRCPARVRIATRNSRVVCTPTV